MMRRDLLNQTVTIDDVDYPMPPDAKSKLTADPDA